MEPHRYTLPLSTFQSLQDVHFVTSIAKFMEVGGIDYRLEDNESDEEELSEPAEICNEDDVRIWLERSVFSCGESTTPHDDMEGNKGNTGMFKCKR
jgi:hypothetical protein